MMTGVLTVRRVSDKALPDVNCNSCGDHGAGSSSKKSLPDGPAGYPLIGNLHLFRGREVPNLYEMMNQWAKQYGNIYTIKMGPKTFNVLNGYELISEVFNHPDVDGRSSSNTIAAALGEGKGPASASGKSWACQRHYAVGFFNKASKYLEDAIAEETSIMTSKLSDQSHDSVDIQTDFFRPALYNILTKVTFGKRLDYSSEEFQVLSKAMDTVFTHHGPATLYYSLNLPFGGPAKIKRKLSDLKVLFEKLIKERRACLATESATPSCYVDGYLMMQRNSESSSGLRPHFTDDNLVMATFEMFFGGTNVPKNALGSILVYLINNPEVQVRCQQEIDNELGKSSASYEDRHRLPYLEATIAECMRLANVTPLAVPRVATRDVCFRGYEFPAGTVFMSNLHSFLMDPETFPEPEKLKPERFIDEEGKYQRPKELSPFGVGMRSCLGEQLAWRELFLITCSVLQKFTLKTPSGHEAPSVTTGTTGVARSPLPFRVQMTER